MATFTTALYAAQAADRVNTSRITAPNVASGDLDVAVASYTLAGTEVAGDVIKLAIVPAGCIPAPQLSSVTCSADPVIDVTVGEGEEAVTTTGELLLDVGTAANADGWADGVDLSAGGQVRATAGTMPAWIAATPITGDSGSGNAVVYATLDTVEGELVAGTVLYFTLALKKGR